MICVYNQNTPEFDSLGLGAVMDLVPWSAPFIGVPNNERGNTAESSGFASSQGQARSGNPEDMGLASPQVLKHTHHYSLHFQAATQVATLIGIEHTQDGYFDSRPCELRRFERFAWNEEALGFGSNMFEGLTKASMYLVPGSRLNQHQDKNNCHDFSDIVVCVRYDASAKRRDCIIAYCRKSCHEFSEKRQLYSAAVRQCKEYFDKLPKPLHLGNPLSYFDYAAAGTGLVGIFHKRSGTLRSIARAVPTSVCRWSSHTSTAADAFNQLQQTEPMTENEVMEVCLSFSSKRSYLGFATVLREWEENGLPDIGPDSSLYDIILEECNAMFGNADGGPNTRFQPFMNRALRKKRARLALKLLKKIRREFNKRRADRQHAGIILNQWNKNAARDEYHWLLGRCSTIHNVGPLTGQLLIEFLIMTR